jgi:tol-pal system protein YbgF
MKPRTLFMLSFVFALTACAPQAELVKTQSSMSELREDTKTTKTRVQELQRHLDQDIQKRLDALEANARGTVEVQKVMADYGAKTDQLTTDIQILQGKLEENNFRIQEFAQKLDDKSFKISELSARVDELEAKIKSLATGTPGASTEPTGTASDKDKKSTPKTIEPSEAYRQAMNDYNSGNFDLALAGFQNYLTQFPETSQTDKAQYWIGECYYSKKEFPKAIDAFSKVIKTYPKSDKVAGAKLKIGYSYLNEKNTAKAKDYLNKVVKEHPGTKEAVLAKEKLRKIGK